MIIRVWLLASIALVVLAWVLMVPLSPPSFQASPVSGIADYRTQGLVPKPGETTISDAVGHDVFEIPETDAEHAAMTDMSDMANMPAMSKSMDMSDDKDNAMPEESDMANMPAMSKSMDMSADKDHAMPEESDMANMPAMSKSMDMSADKDHAMPEESDMANMPAMSKSMDMSDDKDHAMPEESDMANMPGMSKSMDMSDDKDNAMPEESDMANMPAMSKSMDMSDDKDHAMPEESGMAGMSDMQHGETGGESEGGHGGESQAGLRVLDGMMAHMAKRTIEIEMREWGFFPPSITVAMGEAVRLVVRNTGNVPHEFMLMPPQGMAAVAYRLERADWNLTEHVAIFEREVVMPGDTFEVVIQADQPGNWMYMCMFPYHMQFGMMGGLSTEGTAPMEGMNMGGMKM